ncbi:MAG: J domain-containing protein [Enhygromyxa sp.]
MTTVFVDYYELLGVDPGASSAQIKSAYRARMVRDHADQNPGDELAKERMILLTRAKTTLLDERRRSVFDHERMQWIAADRLGVAPPRWQGGRAPDPRGEVHQVQVDLRDVSLSRLIVGVGVAAVVTGFGLAAKAVADRASRRRRRSWF